MTLKILVIGAGAIGIELLGPRGNWHITNVKAADAEWQQALSLRRCLLRF